MAERWSTGRGRERRTRSTAGRAATRAARLPGLVLAAALAAAPTLPTPAAGAVAPPAQWPAADVAPDIDATAHSLRLFGADRYQTNLAAALALRGTGGYPFDTADRSSGGAPVLGEAGEWWGVGACPFSIIVTAADVAADTLAAASLSDPTDGSTEPLLQRSAAANPAFDPVGGFARVDTDTAPIIVTASGRQGATGLALAARVAAADLNDGGCTTARQAIVVGGPVAVPPAVDEELVALGYTEVFRVAGADRYETAALVAEALGTGEGVESGATCLDPDAADGTARQGFHGNAVVEYRPSATTCRLLGRTVVLADGITGADALAAGWWTSFWQAPVLLTGPGGTLPPATRAALQTLAVEHLVVLGGTFRIPDATVAEARQIAGVPATRTVRVAGADRYATSVEMAQVFGGWWPTGDGADFVGSMVCLAASIGDGPASRGWPDALAAGPWCGAASGAAHDPGAPSRALPPTSGEAPAVVPAGRRPARDAVPVLLTPPGASTLAPSVSSLLVEAFDPGADWCTSRADRPACVTPGFAVAFGGPGAVPEQALRQAATLVSGQRYTGFADQAPSKGAGFWTRLDLAPVAATGGDPDGGPDRACFLRDELSSVRWLAVAGDEARTDHRAEHDVYTAGVYATDADGVPRAAGRSAPVCVAWTATDGQTVHVFGVSLSGHATDPLTLDARAARRFTLTAPIEQHGPVERSGAPGTSTEPGAETTWTFASDGIDGIAARSKGTPAAVTGAALALTLERGSRVDEDTPGPHTFTGTVSLATSQGTVTGRVSGEAILDADAGVWRLRGRTTYTGGTWNVTGGAGGFRADLLVGPPPDGGEGAAEEGGAGGDAVGEATEAVAWRLDGLVD